MFAFRCSALISISMIILQFCSPEIDSYRVQGMISSLYCGEIEYSMHCICEELGYSLSSANIACPWKTAKAKRSISRDDSAQFPLGLTASGDSQRDIEAIGHPVFSPFHPNHQDLEADDMFFSTEHPEAPRLRLRRAVNSREHLIDECCNSLTDFHCNVTTMEQYCSTAGIHP